MIVMMKGLSSNNREALRPTSRGGGVGGGCPPPTHRRQGRISGLPKDKNVGRGGVEDSVELFVLFVNTKRGPTECRGVVLGKGGGGAR